MATKIVHNHKCELNDMPKIAIFLGAGFSRAADLPVMSEFARYSESELQSLKQKHGPGSQSPRNAAPLLIDKGDLYESFRKYLNKMAPCWLSSFSADNMEHLFIMAEMMHNCKFPEINLNGQDRSLCEILRAIKLWLWKIYQRIPIHNPSRYKITEEPYNIFIKRLYQHGLNDISIITTNYDMVLEYLFHQQGAQVCYPISENNYKFEDLCAPNIRIASGLPPDGKNAPILCKLHGSVNFFSEYNYNDRKLHIVADTAQKAIGSSTISPRAPSIMAVDAIHELTVNRGLVPEIIPPTYAKLRDNEWLRDIWKYAAKSLINAQKWIFIGYSFPSTDGFMRSLINIALISRNGAPLPQVIVVDKDEEIKKNYTEVFGKQPFTFSKESFTDFIASGGVHNALYDC